MDSLNAGAAPLSPAVAKAENRFRWWLLAMLLGASFLNYFDRQTVSVLKTTLKAEFKMDDPQYALLVNMFTACYSVAYIASGWVADRIGPRRALTLFAGLWSAVTVGCGLARTFTQMAIMRALLGIAEPGFQPVSVRTGAAWAPAGRKGLFLSLCGAGSALGAIAAPPLVVLITLHYHWRWAFVIPGVLGFGLAALWWFTYRDPVSVATETAVANDAALSRLTWGQLWKNRTVWGIILSRMLTDPVWYFCLFWMPGYLQEHKGATLKIIGLVGWLPFVIGNFGGIGLSALADTLARGSPRPLATRLRVMMVVGLVGLVCWLIPAASLSLSVALFCVVALLGCGWLFNTTPIIAEALPLGNVGSVWGMAGAFGAMAAVGFNYLVGHAAQYVGWPALFIIMGCLYPSAALVLRVMVRPVVVPLAE